MPKEGADVILHNMSEDVSDSGGFSAVRLTENEIASLTEDVYDFARRELGMSEQEARVYAQKFISEYRARLKLNKR